MFDILGASSRNRISLPILDVCFSHLNQCGSIPGKLHYLSSEEDSYFHMDPVPKLLVVAAASSRADLDKLTLSLLTERGKVFSPLSFGIRVASYQAVVFCYQFHLWEKILLQELPDDKRRLTQFQRRVKIW